MFSNLGGFLVIFVQNSLLNNYFSRNHRFRKGQFGCCNNALAYVDDDWTGFGDCALDLMLPAANVEVITDPATTDADRYKAEINQQDGIICIYTTNPAF